MRKIIKLIVISLGYCLLFISLTTIPPKQGFSQEISNEQVKQDTTSKTVVIDSLVKLANTKLDNVSIQTKKGRTLAEIAEKKSRTVKKNIIIDTTMIYNKDTNRTFLQKIFGIKKKKLR